MTGEASSLLETWWQHAAVGRALDLGAGEGQQARWLAARGFRVDALERDPGLIAALGEQSRDLTIHPIAGDVRTFQPPREEYDLIVASAVLHFLRPTELWPLVDRLEAALKEGGLLIAEVFTTEDPGYAALRSSGAQEVEPNTFIAPEPVGVIHFFALGELERLFAHLLVLDYEESRRLDAEAEEGYRAGASLVARRPER